MCYFGWKIIRWPVDSPHDDVIKWKHFPSYWPFVRGIHWPPVNSPHKVQWRGALMFSLIWAWINGWVNTRDAGDLRHHRTHYDVIVMKQKIRPEGKCFHVIKSPYPIWIWPSCSFYVPSAARNVKAARGSELNRITFHVICACMLRAVVECRKSHESVTKKKLNSFDMIIHTPGEYPPLSEQTCAVYWIIIPGKFRFSCCIVIY